MRYIEFKLLESRKLLELSDKVKNMLKDRFQKQNPDLTDQQVAYYLDNWDRYAKSFDVQYRDITRLTFNQVETLIDNAVAKSQIKGKAKSNKTNTTSSEDVVYNKNNLEILRGDLREKCIRYGQGYSWCISRRDASNMYFRYRLKTLEPAFYFVFDLDRPKEDVWHAVVIYVNNKNQYFVATADNPGDREMTWEQIEQEHPKLKGLQGLFKHVPISDEEKSAYEKFGKRVNDKTYAAFSLSEKQKYIEFGNLLSPKQQKLTPDELIAFYAKNNPVNITGETYHRIKPGDQRKVMDDIIEVGKPGQVVDFAIALGSGRLSPEHEQKILSNSLGAIKYAEQVLKRRWPELEDKVIKNPKLATEYAKRIIGGRWPNAEQQMLKKAQKNQFVIPQLAGYIIDVAKERIPEFEQIMVSEKYPQAAIFYTRDFLKKRWPELEDALKKSNNKNYLDFYAKVLGLRSEEVGS